jgi:GTP-binding protein LepA
LFKLKIDNIRNFCIIAHIDHGKSTLADRILELTNRVQKRDMHAQLLDQMDIEQERGITIKATAVRLEYKSKVDGKVYILNLIDTPGHVDFTYEVSRSLVACEGAILVVDAAQGVEAQTIANSYLAIDADLEIIPVINKIDLPSADPEGVRTQIEDAVGLSGDDCLLVSAKTGQGVEEILEAIIARIPAPEGDPDAPLKALIFDSLYDSYRGVVSYIRLVDGVLKKRQKVKCMSTGKVYEASELGVFTPAQQEINVLNAGEVGYFVGAIKDIREVRVGDTLTSHPNGCEDALEGYSEPQPVVFAGLYTVDNEDFEDLRDSLGKLRLNDASFVFEPDTSVALGFGFRCGFLGLLHMEVVQERLERDYDLELITTSPSVVYEVLLPNNSVISLHNPSHLPEQFSEIREPYVKLNVYTPREYMGVILELIREKRGEVMSVDTIGGERVRIESQTPFSDIIMDFYDKLKSLTRGYGSMEYEFIGYRRSDLVRLDISIAGDAVDAFCTIVPREQAYRRGSDLTRRLKELIPRQMFEVPIQALAGGRGVARVNIKALRKNVLAKCYGGDISRKRKLLEKQKKGKKRMKQVGSVVIPQEAFMAVLKVE